MRHPVCLKETGQVVGYVHQRTLARLRSEALVGLVLEGVAPAAAARAVMGPPGRAARPVIDWEAERMAARRMLKEMRSPAIRAFHRAIEAAED
jgi:hypothetical protein